MAIGIDEIPATGSSLTIEELGARPGEKQRVLVLLGPGLPKMGAEWGSKLVMQTRWYPGNSAEATQHVMVATEMPSTWEGVWRRTMMGRRPSLLQDETGDSVVIVDPHVLREVLEDIHRSAFALRVTWSVDGTEIIGDPNSIIVRAGASAQRGQTRQVAVRIVREGRISEFSTPIDRHTDIKWKATFEWYGRGAQGARVAKAREDKDIAAIANAFQASANALELFMTKKTFDLTRTIPKGASDFSLGKLESLLLDIDEFASLPTERLTAFQRTVQRGLMDLKRAGEIARKFRELPASLAAQCQTIKRNVQIAAAELDDDMGRGPVESYSAKPGPADVLRAHATTRGARDAAKDVADKAEGIDAALRKTRVSGGNRGVIGSRNEPRAGAGTLLAVHVCRDGETPGTVSRRYYQTADRGVDILRANRLPWHTPTFARGQVLAIPVLANRAGT